MTTREAGETDRRQRHVQLTAKGEKLIEDLASVHHKELRDRSEEMIQALERLRK